MEGDTCDDYENGFEVIDIPDSDRVSENIETLDIVPEPNDESGPAEVDTTQLPSNREFVPNIASRPTRTKRAPSFYGFETEAENAISCFESELALEGSLPKSEKEALDCLHWKKAMEDEYNSLCENSVWSLVPSPQGKNIVGSRWHFAIKRDAQGNISRYKARFVAKGFKQQKGVDFQETYCPTMKLTTFRTLLAIAAQKKMSVHQLDIKTAYLNAPIDEEVFIEQPKGFEKRDPNGNLMVCKLLKSLYGLRQAGRNWYNLLKKSLLQEGFIPSNFDPCLFTRVRNGKKEYVAIWVDDIVYCSENSDFNDVFEALMRKSFKITECSKLNWFLGMKVEQSEEGISLSQKLYIGKLLDAYGMENCKPVSSPCPEKFQFSKSDCPLDGSKEQIDMRSRNFRGLIGSLNYLSQTTRPDLAFVSHSLSCFVNNPGEVHWIAAKRCLRYLKGSIDDKLIYRVSDAITLEGYSDSDWAGCLDSRRSISAYCFFLDTNSAAISWKCKRQATVATSTAEAESVALFEASQEALFLDCLVSEMLDKVFKPVKLYVDNQAAIALCKSNVNSQKVKHFAIKIRYLQDLVDSLQISPLYCPTSEQLADLLTKPLGKQKISVLKPKLIGLQ